MTNPEREMQKACSIPVFTQGPQARCLRMRIQLVRETDFVLSPIGSRKKVLIVDSEVVLNGGEVDGGKRFGNLVFLGLRFT